MMSILREEGGPLIDEGYRLADSYVVAADRESAEQQLLGILPNSPTKALVKQRARHITR